MGWGCLVELMGLDVVSNGVGEEIPERSPGLAIVADQAGGDADGGHGEGVPAATGGGAGGWWRVGGGGRSGGDKPGTLGH